MKLSVILIAVAVILALLFAPAGSAAAEEEAPGPQLPILLLNGAIYPKDYDPESIPSSFRIDGYPSEETALYIVQCQGSIKETWIEEIIDIGGEVRGYLPYNALMVAVNGRAYSRLGGLGFVEWRGPYQPYFKISPALQLRLAQGGEVEVLVELFSGRFLHDTLQYLPDIKVEPLGWEADAWSTVVTMRMSVDSIAEVASLPAVEWMELSTAGTLPAQAEVYATISGGGTTDEQIATGGGGVVAVGDTGLGTGGILGIPATLKDRVLSLFSFRGDEGADVDGHGTAVAGALGEEEELIKVDTGNPSPCSIIAFATGFGLGSPPLPLSIYGLLERSLSEGARVYLSGSVPEGKESLGAYGIYASQRDAFVWNNPDMMVVEAVGNEGTDADGDGRVDQGSLLGGATAKNVLSLGGSENGESAGESTLTYGEIQEVFGGDFGEAPLVDDSSAGFPAGMAAFSSRGPTRDGRIKPDLVAAATDILTLASGGAETAPGIYPTGDPGYVRAYGTSLAAASAAASAAAAREMLARRNGEEPSAALVKAFMVNGAVDLTPGQYGEEYLEIPQAPNVVEGWGIMNLECFSDDDTWLKILDDREGMRLGESRTFKVEVESGDELRVTLAWTDYPSLPEARLHLVNDLDLRVVDPDGTSYYPNGRNSRDPLNNVERVVMDTSGKTGDYTIEVTAWNVPVSPQTFALVAQVL
ncbi:MAG: S8 family serine peptidase [Actinomycetota bacterium]|nr:S8 family serine peptidase [Actinomycetota bacterium]